MRFRLLALASALLLIGGCANPTSQTLNTEGVETQFQTTNSATYRSNADGTVEMNGSFNGAQPALTQLDADGFWGTSSSPLNAINAPGLGQIISGTNIHIDEAIVRADGTLELRGLDTSASDVIAALDAQVAAVVAAAEGMTDAEAERYIEALRAAAEAGSTVAAEALQRLVVPVP